MCFSKGVHLTGKLSGELKVKCALSTQKLTPKNKPFMSSVVN
jgi:hypothetical protein